MPTLGVVVPTLNEALVLPTLVNRLLGAHRGRLVQVGRAVTGQELEEQEEHGGTREDGAS